jgi:hypothetical protein
VIAQSPTTPTSARLDGVRVLAVEHRPDHLALITRMLTEAGAKVSGVMKPDFARLMHVVAHAAGR